MVFINALLGAVDELKLSPRPRILDHNAIDRQINKILHLILWLKRTPALVIVELDELNGPCSGAVYLAAHVFPSKSQRSPLLGTNANFAISEP